MNILIIGGSGILSADFTRKCLDAGNTVFILNRGRNKSFIDDRANLIVADWRNESQEQLIEKIAQYKFDVAVDFLTFNVCHLKKTLNIVGKRVQQYVFISSATTYKEVPDGTRITEGMPIGNDKWSYAYDKYRCEELLSQTDINYTIIRPYVTFGDSRIPFPIIPDRYHYTLLARILEEKPVLLYNAGRAICTLTSTRDFADALCALLLNPQAFKEVFQITSDNIQTWGEVYEEICRILNKPMHGVSLSQEDIHRYFPEYETILLGDKGRNMIFDNSKIVSVVGKEVFSTDLRTGLNSSIEYYLKHEYMQGIDYKFDGKCDYFLKKKGIKNLTPIKLGNRDKSTRKVFYYLTSIKLLRIVYDGLRNLKNKV